MGGWIAWSNVYLYFFILLSHLFPPIPVLLQSPGQPDSYLHLYFDLYQSIRPAELSHPRRVSQEWCAGWLVGCGYSIDIPTPWFLPFVTAFINQIRAKCLSSSLKGEIRDGIETPDETIVSIGLEVFWINYLSTYGVPSIFLNIYSSYLVPTYQILSNF